MNAVIIAIVICATVLILGIVGEVGKCVRNKQDNERMLNQWQQRSKFADEIESRRERK